MTKKTEKDEGYRIVLSGRPNLEQCQNEVITSRYTLLKFLPVAIYEQFRRVANLYFLIVGAVMFIGQYTDLYSSVVDPVTVLFPLGVVISVSLLQEGIADLGRHRSDSRVNNHPCVILRRSEELDAESGKRDDTITGGQDVKVELQKNPLQSTSTPSTETSELECCRIAFESIKRMNIRQGHLVLVRNRDMIPADLVILASSADNGNAYIETSSIDGETNLKLRSIPNLPKEVMEKISEQSSQDVNQPEGNATRETLEQATKRICRSSILAFPSGHNAIVNPANGENSPAENDEMENAPSSASRLMKRVSSMARSFSESGRHGEREQSRETDINYVVALKSEPPNASVNTFNGVLFLPPIESHGPSVEVPLNSENFLLRGAVLRNTEWMLGLSCYTGKDTKLVRNSFETPSKLSRLDELINRTVFYILTMMFTLIAILAAMARSKSDQFFDQLWYVGMSTDQGRKWPYLPDDFEGAPIWETKDETDNFIQLFFRILTTVFSLVPVTLYVTVEIVTAIMRLLINTDRDMYDPYTDTRSIARSTTVTDPGQVEYIFSDKTGTLTQNVMRFKRCSVGGTIFGAPVTKPSPDPLGKKKHSSFFAPIENFLFEKMTSKMSAERDSEGLETPRVRNVAGKFEEFEQDDEKKAETASDTFHTDAGLDTRCQSEGAANTLSFNKEMFLRVMSLCHTVVVEKDFDVNTNKDVVPTLQQGDNDIESGLDDGKEKGDDGAPKGFAYQAESPDEGALVEAASTQFDFQLIGRGSTGIRLSVKSSSIFSNKSVLEKLKNGSITEEELAADTASPESVLGLGVTHSHGTREEIWEVLAVNKFDSTRKRMSVVLRSPPELGSIPMLLCKGADSAMLDQKVIKDPSHILIGNENPKEINEREKMLDNNMGNAFNQDSNLSLQSHLGEFAREGLRTLVLGVRLLSEDECTEWLAEYNAAATSIQKRDEKLTEAAMSIETKLHIVGATAIEDKLQVGVADTIEMLGRAGIKLWVLTGDKRETAKEIGYATKVLTQKMRPGLIEVAKAAKGEVHARMAMAFLKLVKFGRLPHYQTSAINTNEPKIIETFLFKSGKRWRSLKRKIRRFWHQYVKVLLIQCFSVPLEDPALLAIIEEEEKEKEILQLTERRRNVRNRADKIVRDYLNSPQGMAQRRTSSKKEVDDEITAEEMDMPSSKPDVFDKANSAKALLTKRQSIQTGSSRDRKELTIAELAKYAKQDEDEGLSFDEDLLSMRTLSFTDANNEDFDTRKRTQFEMFFSTDKAVRDGRLLKHMSPRKIERIKDDELDEENIPEQQGDSGTDQSYIGPRALVIEGAALEHLLGDVELEELLFAVANTCDSVIACRVSPAQKAQLVQLVRRYVVPEPVTLAIGDGANDVGMIQEAHVGVGISGKEGQQAVNASDFAIAQFRFLQELILIHGRWNFMRLSTVVLYIFYKNAVMVFCMIVYFGNTLYSGTLLFDQWVVSSFNIVTFAPIVVFGIFDRCLDKTYVKKHPEVYAPSRRNEIITGRTVTRWGIFAIIHMLTLYYLSMPALATGGASASSAFFGLMNKYDRQRPGDGESGDLKTVGFNVFTCLMLLMTYKVLLESNSIIVGQWPACTCRKSKGEGWSSRLAYTWIGCFFLSILTYVLGMYLYSSSGQKIENEYAIAFLGTVSHAFEKSVRSWMIILFVPLAGIMFDIAAKLFGNFFYPTQTQIHTEIFAKLTEDENAQVEQSPRSSDESYQA